MGLGTLPGVEDAPTSTTDDSAFYHRGMREMQERFGARRLADRLEELTVHDHVTDADQAFIDEAAMLFLATADDQGRPDVSYKGGHPGFVRVLDQSTVAFAVYDGNGQFRSLGNIAVNPAVGLLFVRFDPPWRIRVNGEATVQFPDDDPVLVASFHGAVAVVVIRTTQVFPNCGRYVHRSSADISTYAPALGHEPPEAEWKQMDMIRPYLPETPAPA